MKKLEIMIYDLFVVIWVMYFKKIIGGFSLSFFDVLIFREGMGNLFFKDY